MSIFFKKHPPETSSPVFTENMFLSSIKRKLNKKMYYWETLKTPTINYQNDKNDKEVYFRKLMKTFDTSFAIITISKKEEHRVIDFGLKHGRIIVYEKIRGLGSISPLSLIYFGSFSCFRERIYVQRIRKYSFSKAIVLGEQTRIDFNTFLKMFDIEIFCDYCGENEMVCKCNLEEIQKIEKYDNKKRLV